MSLRIVFLQIHILTFNLIIIVSLADNSIISKNIKLDPEDAKK